MLRKADAIYLEELYRHDLYDKISQAFAVFLPVKSVAVLGDARAYDYVIALRAVETVDFMTAIWARIPYEVLATISNRIINEVRGISRVVYDISGQAAGDHRVGVADDIGFMRRALALMRHASKQSANRAVPVGAVAMVCKTAR